jgi:hypothetical protein
MKTKIGDWYETAYLIVNGFEPEFKPCATRSAALDAWFPASLELERSRRDFADNRGCPILSLREAMKEIARKNAAYRQAVRP